MALTGSCGIAGGWLRVHIMSGSEMKVVPNEAAQTDQVKEITPPTFGESFDYKQLFRVKGKSGLFVLINSSKLRNNMIAVGRLREKKSMWVNLNDLQSLADLVFFNNAGDKIGVDVVLNNCNAHSMVELQKKTGDELCAVMVPDYNPKKFRAHDAQKVLLWFIELKTALEYYNKQNEIIQEAKKSLDKGIKTDGE